MKVELSPSVIEAIQTIQELDGGMDNIIFEVENFILDNYRDDDNMTNPETILHHIRELRFVRRYLRDLCEKDK